MEQPISGTNAATYKLMEYYFILVTLSFVIGLKMFLKLAVSWGISLHYIILILHCFFPDKRSTPESSPTSSPRQSFRRASVGVTPVTSPGGVAPIATQEHLDEDDLEEDNPDSKGNDSSIDGKIQYLSRSLIYQVRHTGHQIGTSMKSALWFTLLEMTQLSALKLAPNYDGLGKG